VAATLKSINYNVAMTFILNNNNNNNSGIAGIFSQVGYGVQVNEIRQKSQIST